MQLNSPQNEMKRKLNSFKTLVYSALNRDTEPNDDANA